MSENVNFEQTPACNKHSNSNDQVNTGQVRIVIRIIKIIMST